MVRSMVFMSLVLLQEFVSIPKTAAHEISKAKLREQKNKRPKKFQLQQIALIELHIATSAHRETASSVKFNAGSTFSEYRGF